jgi:hypothetical protein
LINSEGPDMTEHLCPEEIDKAIERMTIRGRQHVLYVLWNHIGPDPRPFRDDDPAARLISDSEVERVMLAAAPPVFIDAATALRAAADRLEQFRLILNVSQRSIIDKATAALRAMALEPPEAFVAWHPYTQAELTAELAKLAALVTRH